MNQVPEIIEQVTKMALSQYSGLPEDRISVLSIRESRNSRLLEYLKNSDIEYYKYELGEEAW